MNTPQLVLCVLHPAIFIYTRTTCSAELSLHKKQHRDPRCCHIFPYYSASASPALIAFYSSKLYSASPYGNSPNVNPLHTCLLRPIKERHSLTTRTIIIDTKRPLLFPFRISFCNAVLVTPKDCIIEHMALLNIPERGT